MKKILFLFLLILILFSGCTKKETVVWKCNLPSQPGRVHISIYGFPDVVFPNDKLDLLIEFKNYLIQPVKVNYIYSPNFGKNIKGYVEINKAEYLENKLMPFTKNVELKDIEISESEFSKYEAYLIWEYNVKTTVFIPVCLADLKSKEIKACKLTPKPCYSSSPVVPVITKLSSYGKDKNVILIINFYIKDVYNCLLNDTIEIKNIKLKFDYENIPEGNIFVCKPKENGKIVIRKDENLITCIFYLNKLIDYCKTHSCYYDESTIKVGKSGILYFEYEYTCRHKKFIGSAKILKI